MAEREERFAQRFGVGAERSIAARGSRARRMLKIS